MDILLRDGNDSSGWYFYSAIMPIVEGPRSKAPYTITAYTDDGAHLLLLPTEYDRRRLLALPLSLLCLSSAGRSEQKISPLHPIRVG